MNEAKRRLGYLGQYIGLRLILIGCLRHRHGSLELYANDADEGQAPLWLEKVSRALSLIEALQLSVYRRMGTDVDRILVDRIRGPMYYPPGRVVWLHGPGLHNAEVEAVAGMLVHEATHARIATNRIRYSRDVRARHELACVKAEVRFAMRIGRTDLAERAVAKLDEPWWSDEDLKKRALAEFDRLGLGGPVGRLLRHRVERSYPPHE